MRFVVDTPEKYPELLQDMAQAAGDALLAFGLTEPEAQVAALQVVDNICQTVGGSQYLPQGFYANLARRNRKICSEFDGKNWHALANKYELTVTQIRNIVNAGIPRQRPQRTLF